MIYFLHMDKRSFAPDKDAPKPSETSGVHARRDGEVTRVQRAPAHTWERFTAPSGDAAESTRAIRQKDVAEAVRRAGSDLLGSDIRNAYQQRAEFNDRSVDPDLLEAETNWDPYARLPEEVRNWQPRRPLSEYGNTSIRRGLGGENAYTRGQVPYSASMESALQEFSASEQEEILADIEQKMQEIRGRWTQRGDELRAMRNVRAEALERKRLSEGGELEYNDSMEQSLKEFEQREVRDRIDSIASRVKAERARRPPEMLETLPSSYLEADDEVGTKESRQDRYNRYAHLARYFEDLPDPIEDLSGEVEDDPEADAERARRRAAGTSPGRRFPPQRAV